MLLEREAWKWHDVRWERGPLMFPCTIGCHCLFVWLSLAFIYRLSRIAQSSYGKVPISTWAEMRGNGGRPRPRG